MTDSEFDLQNKDYSQHIKKDAELKEQEEQVENIIKLLKEEFDINDEIISSDTGFQESSNNPSLDNNLEESENECRSTIDRDYLYKDDFKDENELKSFIEVEEFIEKAKDFGANALDLSKKNLNKIPIKLIELKNIQYIYMEGNKLKKLPNNFFKIFSQLIWLDLRNNELTDLPIEDLDKHENLRYLLLENNKIKKLPCEISNLKNLAAINLTDNPIEYPPFDIVQKGCKQIQEYMKNDYLSKNNQNVNLDQNSNCSTNYLNEIKSISDDIWASDDEDDTSKSRFKSGTSYKGAKSAFNSNSNYLKNCEFRIKSATRNLLIANSMRPLDAQFANFDLRERLTKAKLNANKLRKTLPPNDISVYKNEEFEKALRSGKIDEYKKDKEKINSKIQKINDKSEQDNFRENLKKQQRKLFNKRLVKGVDYVEPVHNAPFDIDEDHLKIMTNEERRFLDRQLEMERIRSLSPETLSRIEEERRLRDHKLQDKIREYTNKLLSRKDNRNENPKYDKIQAAKDIRELKTILREIEQRRYEIQFNIRENTGGLRFREQAKLNAKQKSSKIKK